VLALFGRLDQAGREARGRAIWRAVPCRLVRARPVGDAAPLRLRRRSGRPWLHACHQAWVSFSAVLDALRGGTSRSRSGCRSTGSRSGNFEIPWSFLVDPLSCVMMLVVTGVGSLIHVYSIATWRTTRISPLLSYLNLFTSFMLLLVLAAACLSSSSAGRVSPLLVLLIGFCTARTRRGRDEVRRRRRAPARHVPAPEAARCAFTMSVI